MGYPPVLRAQPNPIHYAISALLHTSHLSNIITQNVDGLHLKASSLDVEDNDPRIMQLHGSLHVRNPTVPVNDIKCIFPSASSLPKRSLGIALAVPGENSQRKPAMEGVVRPSGRNWKATAYQPRW